jgi:Fe2+ transport system protein FeoA
MVSVKIAERRTGERNAACQWDIGTGDKARRRRTLAAKLSAMGIVPGTIILKKSHSILHGPIVIQNGPVQIAIGYRMAQKDHLCPNIYVFCVDFAGWEKQRSYTNRRSSSAGRNVEDYGVPGVKKVIIVGNPNVGKSLLFSRLTGINVISSNYAGTTVAVKTGTIRYSNQEFELFDIPGVYSLEAFSKADETALAIINECRYNNQCH